MADETSTELSIDQQLDQLFKDTGSPDPALSPDPKAELGTKAQPATSPAEPAKPEGETPTEEDPIEKALKEIEDPKEDPPEVKPTLTPEQQTIFKAIPDAQTAVQLLKTVENYSNFTSAFEARDFKNVETMFTNWDKDAYEAFLDHVYAQKVASGEWVDRFIAEQEGRGTEHKGMKALEQKIAKLEGKLTEKERGNQRETQAAESERVFSEYNKYVDGLFDKISTPKGDRRLIALDLKERVANDPKVIEAVRKGNMTALHGMFKTAVREFNNRDKEVAETTDTKIAQQLQKKPPLSGGAGGVTDGDLPDDVRQVPKGQEDTWLNQQLGKLAKKAGLGKK